MMRLDQQRLLMCHRRFRIANVLCLIGVAVTLLWAANLFIMNELSEMHASQYRNRGLMPTMPLREGGRVILNTTASASLEQQKLTISLPRFHFESSALPSSLSSTSSVPESPSRETENVHANAPYQHQQQQQQSSHNNGSESSITQVILDSQQNKPSNILHIVTTRFMQFQPHLLHLGVARLWLFETFCLPPMIHQLEKDFVWAILVDPDLPDILLQHMMQLLRPYPNFYLIRSNSARFTMDDLTATPVRTGNITHLQEMLTDPRRNLVLQTRVDADDGIHRKTIWALQNKARQLMHVNAAGWKIICAKLNYEWRNMNIMQSTLASEKVGSGKLRIVQEQICITPGLTMAYARNTTADNAQPLLIPPPVQHQLINRKWSPCKDPPHASSANCWTRLPGFPAAIRSRTITSAGMSRINAEPKHDNSTDTLWRLLSRDYHIPRDHAQQTSGYLHDHLQDIVKDNLDGQCSHGHSCKKSSKKKLESVLDQTWNDTRVLWQP